MSVFCTNGGGLNSVPTPPMQLKPKGVPDAPLYAEVFRSAASDSSVMVYWSFVPHPIDRGARVTSFAVQWDTTPDFSTLKETVADTASFSSVRIPFVADQAIMQYNISGLSSGSVYFVRVCAVNSVGRGPYTNAAFTQTTGTNTSNSNNTEYAIIPRAKSRAIEYGSYGSGGVQLTTLPVGGAVSVRESASSLKVSFAAPLNTYGSSISQYKVEWWLSTSSLGTFKQVPEVKVVIIAGSKTQSSVPSGVYGTFRLRYSTRNSYDTTGFLSVDASADDVRTALEALTDVRALQVTRQEATGALGYVWSITFLHDFCSEWGAQLTLVDTGVTLRGANNVTVLDVVRATLPPGYGSAVLAAAQGISSYVYVIRGLTPGSWYSARVSSINEAGISSAQIATPMSLSPPLQKPGNPLDVNLSVDSATSLSVRYLYPESDGGDPVTKYKIEWDTSPFFNSTTDGPVGLRHNLQTPSQDCKFVHCVYIVSSLATSVPYFVRVFAYNSFGYSVVPGFSTHGAVPMTQPNPPALVAVALDVTSTDSISVTISSPIDDGGGPVTQYKVEWDVLGAEAYSSVTNPDASLLYSPYEVQLIRLSSNLSSISGYFYISFNGFSSTSIPANASADILCSTLTSIPTVADVVVVRSDLQTPLNGYEWTVTFRNSEFFNTSKNGAYFSVPQMLVSNKDGSRRSDFLSKITVPTSSYSASSTLAGTNISLSTQTLVQAMAGYEQQAISVDFSAGSSISGTFKLTIAGQATDSLPANATPGDVQSALMLLPAIDHVVVKRRDNWVGGVGFSLVVVVLEPLGDIEQIRIDATALVSDDGRATKKIAAVELVKGLVPVMESKYYGNTVISVRTMYLITDLQQGLNYHVRVSAWNGAGGVYGIPRGSFPALIKPINAPLMSPYAVTLSPVDEKTLSINWTGKVIDGGDFVTRYTVEYDYAPSVAEIQTVSLTVPAASSVSLPVSISGLSGSPIPIPTSHSSVRGTFCLSYAEFTTGEIPFDASQNRIQHELQALIAIGNVTVSRSYVTDNLFNTTQWIITFTNNVGNLPLLTVGCNSLVGNNFTLVVSETRAGQAVTFTGGSSGIVQRALGGRDFTGGRSVYTITVNASSVDLDGFFYVVHSGETSMGINVYSSAAQMKNALQAMLTIDSVDVSVTDHSLETSMTNEYGRTWTVTFFNNQGGSLLVSTGQDADVVATGNTLLGTESLVAVQKLSGNDLSTVWYVGGLATGVNYVARVSSFNGIMSPSAVSAIAAAPAASRPSAPLQVFMRALSDSQLLVWWSPPAFNGT